jgi:transglutaminase-like putative cysteine protease
MKRFTAFIVALLLLMPSQAFAVSTPKQIGIEIESSASGIVSAYYSNQTDKRLKVLVEKAGQKYYYDLDNTGLSESFPLQMGEGSYKVTIFENVSNTSYRAVLSKTLFADFDEANLTYLQSVQSVDWNTSMAAMAIAQDLVKDKKTDLEKVTAIHDYVTTNVQYDYEKISTITTTYLPDIDETLTLKKGICYDFASTFAGMLRSVGIPAKLIKGYTVNANGYHAWNEVYIDGAWVVIDASYDSQMKARSNPLI